MKNPPKRVLVAGGNGVTGKLIVRYLTGFKLPVQVDIAARTALRAQNLPEQVRKIDIDFQNKKATSALFGNMILSSWPLAPSTFSKLRCMKYVCRNKRYVLI